MMITKYLMHITTEENADSIKKSNKFIPSVHTINGNEWLGDGIYFWDSNDDDAIKIGISLVQNKPENKYKKVKIKKISLQASTREEKYINLDDEQWARKFRNFLRKSFPDGEELFKLFAMLRSQEKVDHKDHNRMGKMMGNAVNFFTEILEKEKHKKIDIISYYFYQTKKESIFLPNKEIYIRQYCIKNEKLINNTKASKWKVEFIA